MGRIVVTRADRQMFVAIFFGGSVLVFAWLMQTGDILPAACVLGSAFAFGTVLVWRAWRRQAAADKAAVPTHRGWSGGELKLLNPPHVGFDGHIEVDLDAGTAVVGPPAGAAETTEVLPSPVPREPKPEQPTAAPTDLPLLDDVWPWRTWMDADVATELDHMTAVLDRSTVGVLDKE